MGKKAHRVTRGYLYDSVRASRLADHGEGTDGMFSVATILDLGCLALDCFVVANHEGDNDFYADLLSRDCGRA